MKHDPFLEQSGADFGLIKYPQMNTLFTRGPRRAVCGRKKPIKFITQLATRVGGGRGEVGEMDTTLDPVCENPLVDFFLGHD